MAEVVVSVLETQVYFCFSLNSCYYRLTLMGHKTVNGFLKRDGLSPVLVDSSGGQIFVDAIIWNGYLEHWEGMMLNGMILDECDYVTGKQIMLLWPDEPRPVDYVELYYNERLIKYPMSILGHIAINVNGRIFNFSHLLNECEILTEAEYFYRPALGKFGPSPDGFFDLSDIQRPYLDKFGRQFMRTIHTARITGIDTVMLDTLLNNKISDIHNTPVDPAKLAYWSGFNKFTNNCTTIIRDTLRGCGLDDISGIFPRDMFISAVWSFSKKVKDRGLTLSVFRREQLAVAEAPPSRVSPLINPVNRVKRSILNRRGIAV